jgi:hypothetical protein
MATCSFSTTIYIQENGFGPLPQGLNKTYPHQTLPEPWITPPSLQQTMVSSNLGARSQESATRKVSMVSWEFLKTTLREIGYSTKQIRWALNLAVRTSKPKD